MNKNKRFYVAYGSNLHLGQMAYRCPDAEVVGSTLLQDWRLMFKGSRSGNYATIEPFKGESVPVALWAISAADERSLDRYEGFPVFYHKEPLRVSVDGVDYDAMVYVMRDDAKVGAPSDGYVATLAHGYQTFDFDFGILERALMRCAR